MHCIFLSDDFLQSKYWFFSSFLSPWPFRLSRMRQVLLICQKGGKMHAILESRDEEKRQEFSKSLFDYVHKCQVPSSSAIVVDVVWV